MCIGNSVFLDQDVFWNADKQNTEFLFISIVNKLTAIRQDNSLEQTWKNKILSTAKDDDGWNWTLFLSQPRLFWNYSIAINRPTQAIFHSFQELLM